MVFIYKIIHIANTSINFYNANNEKYTMYKWLQKEYIATGFLKFFISTIAKAVRYCNRDDGRNCSTIIFTIKNWFTDFN